MRGTGPVRVNKEEVYGYYSSEGDSLRLRLSLDEWDRLGLCQGQQVKVGLPGRELCNMLITTETNTPPVIWLDLRPMNLARAG